MGLHYILREYLATKPKEREGAKMVWVFIIYYVSI